jgi:ankyrin repeat protein
MGANPNLCDQDGETALHYAVRQGQLKISELLLSWGAKDEAKDVCGRTAIHLATINGNEELLRELLMHTADPNIKCKDGMTALHYAAYEGFEHLISILLEYGANVAAKDKFGKTALHNAIRKGHRGTALALLDWCNEDGNRASTGKSRTSKVINEEDNLGLTPLHYAASKNLDLVSDLVNRGADLQARCAWGVLPVHLAAKAGRKDIVLTLLKRIRSSRHILDRISAHSINTPCVLLSSLASIYSTDHIYQSFLGDALWDETLSFDAIDSYERSIQLNPMNTFISQKEHIKHVKVKCRECSKWVTGVRYRCLRCRNFDFCSRCYMATTWKSHSQRHVFMSIPRETWHCPS